MLVWATEFRAKKGATADDLVPLAQRWLIGSPHSSWDRSMFQAVPDGEVVQTEHDGQRIDIARAAIQGRRWAGFQHSWIDDGKWEWVTEGVGYESEIGLDIAIRLQCNLLRPDVRLPTPKKPYIVRQAVDELGGGLDGHLPVDANAIVLAEPDVEEAVRLIRGEGGWRLPVVYCSATRAGTPAVDAEQLAKWLSGMAHVVVEPSQWFAFALARHVDDASPYGGAVSIYWPRGAGRQVRLLATRFSTTSEFQAEASVIG